MTKPRHRSGEVQGHVLDDSTVRAAPARRPTMLQVAARAGVSLKTVSRVVNREPGVSVDLTQRVDLAVVELGYRHNTAASSLRRIDRKHKSVAVLLEDLGNPFSAALLRAVEDEAHAHGAIVLAASLDGDPQREHSLTELFVNRRADALLIVPAADDQSHLAPEVNAGTHVVFVDRPGRGLDADCVLTTNRPGAHEAVRHLLSAGHHRIAFVANSASHYTVQERYAGYVDALTEAGVEVDPVLVEMDLHDLTTADGCTVAMMHRQPPPTAIFSGQNMVTVGVIRALRRLRLEHDIALVGFDDFMLAEMLDPGITVVAQDPSAMGSTAARVLFSRLAGDDSPPRTHLIPTTLIRRGSGEIRA